ncbi:unnamed protein product, partial [Phaeothamnion confervicola]
FDTGQAARYLGLPSFSYAHLLDRYCGVMADKRHQLSDWRVRPLPAEMLLYACSDTHYLLYIADRLRTELHARGGAVALRTVLDASRMLCGRRYEKEPFRPSGYDTVLQRQGHRLTAAAANLSGEQRRVMAALWEWRDATARREDESLGYVMSAYVMSRVAAVLPASADALGRCGNPLPPLLRERAEEVLALVARARA